MHTYEEEKTTFIGNSDLSGDIIVKTDKGELEVSGKDLINFALGYIIRKKISKLEQLDGDDLINYFLK